MKGRAVFQHTHAPSCLSAPDLPLRVSLPICCAGVRVSRPCPGRHLVLRPTCCPLPPALHLVLHPSCWALVLPHPRHHQVWRPSGLLLLVWPQQSPTRSQSRPWGASCRCRNGGQYQGTSHEMGWQHEEAVQESSSALKAICEICGSLEQVHEYW